MAGLLSFVPCYNVADTNLPQSCSKGGDGEEERGNDNLPLVQDLEKRRLLHLLSEPPQTYHAGSCATCLGELLFVIIRLADARGEGGLWLANGSLSQAIALIGARGHGSSIGSHV